VKQAQRYGMSPREFAEQVSKSGNVGVMVADLRREKALMKVLESATVTDADGAPVDLTELWSPEGQQQLDEFEAAESDSDDLVEHDDVGEVDDPGQTDAAGQTMQ